jgi:small conductance mechanosensitive channel
MNSVEVVTFALENVVSQLVMILPKLIIALVIWYIGKYLLGLASKLIGKIDIKKTKVDDKAIAMLTTLVDVVGRIVLVLVILDYLGIGRTIIGALTQGVTFAIAIALGLSFGRALEDDAKRVVANFRKLFKE